MKSNSFLALGAVVAVAAGGALYGGLGSAGETAAAPAASETQPATLATIYRDPGCGCCDAYAEYLEARGFAVELFDDRDYVRRSLAAGVPEQGLACHHAVIDGYVVDGLVPAGIIRRLLDERPAITGITLPGMPANAPGMAPEKTGTLRVYAFGPDGVSVYSDE
jgi:hypothetical protein